MVHGRMYRKISFILVMALFLTGIYLDTAADDAFCVILQGARHFAPSRYTLILTVRGYAGRRR